MATTTAQTTTKTRAKAVEQELDATYNEFKEFEGKKYTGMKVGRSHKWYYDSGEWKETKVTPDKWEFTYAVKKRRAGHAPEGSGVPVGTGYHWYILAHQNVTKLDANTYTTAMAGMKYKLAHMRADKGKWSASDRAQRKRLIQILQEMIDDLRKSQEEEAIEPAAQVALPLPISKNGHQPRSRKRQVTRPQMLSKNGQRPRTRKRELVGV